MTYVPNALLSRLVGDCLVAVTFVLDSYLQLQFDNANMTVEAWPTVTFDGRRWSAADLGYADSLRQLCGGVVLSTSERTGDGLPITLSTGEIHINPALDEIHAEIATLHLRASTDQDGPGEWMSWRPGEDSFEHLPLTRSAEARHTLNGLAVLPRRGRPVTNTAVERLREEEGV